MEIATVNDQPYFDAFNKMDENNAVAGEKMEKK